MIYPINIASQRKEHLVLILRSVILYSEMKQIGWKEMDSDEENNLPQLLEELTQLLNDSSGEDSSSENSSSDLSQLVHKFTQLLNSYSEVIESYLQNDNTSEDTSSTELVASDDDTESVDSSDYQAFTDCECFPNCAPPAYREFDEESDDSYVDMNAFPIEMNCCCFPDSLATVFLDK